MTPTIRFGAIDADGERVLITVRVTLGGLLSHEARVGLSESDARKLIASIQGAIARLGRPALGR
jgi:hypothetical protein